MNPQLLALAERLGPMIGRLGSRMGSLGAPGLGSRAMQIAVPQVPGAQPPASPGDGPRPPISQSNYGTPSVMTAGAPQMPQMPQMPAMIGAGNGAIPFADNPMSFGPTVGAAAMRPPEALMAQASPASNAQPDMGETSNIPVGDYSMPQFGNMPPDMGQTRNIPIGDYMMPQFGNPEPATGPDLIQKFMTYLRDKGIG